MTLMVGVYVDDLIVTGTSDELIDAFKKPMKKVFDMSELGNLSYYLRIEVLQTKSSIILSQVGYVEKILQATGMGE